MFRTMHTAHHTVSSDTTIRRFRSHFPVSWICQFRSYSGHSNLFKPVYCPIIRIRLSLYPPTIICRHRGGYQSLSLEEIAGQQSNEKGYKYLRCSDAIFTIDWRHYSAQMSTAATGKIIAVHFSGQKRLKISTSDYLPDARVLGPHLYCPRIHHKSQW